MNAAAKMSNHSVDESSTPRVYRSDFTTDRLVQSANVNPTIGTTRLRTLVKVRKFGKKTIEMQCHANKLFYFTILEKLDRFHFQYNIQFLIGLIACSK